MADQAHRERKPPTATVPDDELIAQYIEANPHRPSPDEARLVVYGVPVWAIIGHLKAVGGDVARTAREYDVPAEAVQAAKAYYKRHKGLIDAWIVSNIV